MSQQKKIYEHGECFIDWVIYLNTVGRNRTDVFCQKLRNTLFMTCCEKQQHDHGKAAKMIAKCIHTYKLMTWMKSAVYHSKKSSTTICNNFSLKKLYFTQDKSVSEPIWMIPESFTIPWDKKKLHVHRLKHSAKILHYLQQFCCLYFWRVKSKKNIYFIHMLF